MSFGVANQYKMSITIDKFEDFLTDDKFISFKMVENIGLSLPYWELQFDCVYPELLRYLNEKQPILVQLGSSTQDLSPMTLVIKRPIIMPESVSSSKVTLRGFTSIQSYLENEFMSSFTNHTTKDLAEYVAKKYGLTFKSNMQDTKDKMTYYQSAESDYKFLFNAWLHSYYQENDIIIPAINSKSTLSYNSLRKMIAETDLSKLPTFVDSEPETNEIQVDANSGLDSDTSMSNSFGNYMKERYIYDKITGLFTHIKIDNNTPIISESKTNSVDENISKSSGFFTQNSSVHANYYKQELVNTQKYFSIQSSRQWVSAADTLVSNVYPGDLVLYMTKKADKQVNDQLSCMYIVNRRVVSIKNRKVHTNFLLSRENMNYSK